MNDLIKRIDELIDSSDEVLIRDTTDYVNIKSDEGEPEPFAPFGAGPKAVIDKFLADAERDGFITKDYGVGVASAATGAGEIDLGIWLHGDVVPAGDDWRYPPYNATYYKGCVIGRGATDNKGQLAAIYNLFLIFKSLGVDLGYNAAIFVGSNEETGMRDIDGGKSGENGFLQVAKPPRMSLVPDSGFPVGYGGKGAMTLTLKSTKKIKSFTITGGLPEARGYAEAEIKNGAFDGEISGVSVTRGEKTTISAYSIPRHTTNPDPNGNMITALARALLESGAVAKSERFVPEFLRDISLDIYGELLGINTEHEVMKRLTVYPLEVRTVQGNAELVLAIRYPVGITCEEIVARAEKYAKTRGFTVAKGVGRTTPYLLDPNSREVKLLHEASREVTGEDKEPFTLSGGTYAHKLPNAFVFGTNGNLPPDDFEKGRGGAHGVDECVSIERLKRAMKIYARALLRLKEIL